MPESTAHSDEMPGELTRLLLVEDNPGDARLIREMLREASPHGPDIVDAASLGQALELLSTMTFEAVLLDLGLPDSQGEATLNRIVSAMSEMPVVVLTGEDNDSFGQRLLKLGAQDYLVKGDVEGRALRRSLSYAVERKRAALALERAKHQAEAANRAKSQFLAMMSHELRTPLNAVIGYTELLQEQAAEQGLTDIVTDLDNIHAAGRQLLDLVNDVLDLSKIESEHVELTITSFDVSGLLEEAVTAVRPLIAHNKNEIEVRDDIPLTIRSDRSRLRQVLVNLLSNAAKFTENGLITLSAVDERQDDVCNVVLSVRDTGIGIDPDRFESLFEPFVQVDGSYSRRYEGTGLGLTIARRLCRMMGGDIGVSSRLGEGALFTVRLPTDPGVPADVRKS